MSIGKNIRLKRIELKLTQQQLTDQVYVTRQTISKWELGKSQPDLLSQKHLEQASIIYIFYRYKIFNFKRKGH